MTRLNRFSKYLQKEQLSRLFFFLLLLSATGCHISGNDQQEAIAFQAQRLRQYNDSIYPKVAKLVRTGDIVTRLGTDITSEMLRQMNQVDKRFSHIGIASIESDTTFIYHAIGGEFNPDLRIKREPLYSFLHAADNKGAGIYRLQVSVANAPAIALKAKGIYNTGIPFDMAFDYQTEDRLYCAEFVAKCIGRSLKDSSWLAFSTAGKFSYVAVDNITNSKILQPVFQKFY